MTEARVDYTPQPPLKVYMGHRWSDDRVSVMVAVVTPGLLDEGDGGAGSCVALHHVVHHSPTGMEWGYAGSGPADLALSILANHFGEKPSKLDLGRGWTVEGCECGDDREGEPDPDCVRCDGSGDRYEPLKCWTYHHPFKDQFLARAGRSWAITSDQVHRFVGEMKDRQRRRDLEAKANRDALEEAQGAGADVDPDYEQARADHAPGAGE